MTDVNFGKSVFLGNGDILKIESIKDNLYGCSHPNGGVAFISKDAVIEAAGVENIRTIDGVVDVPENVDLVCAPKGKGIEKNEGKTLVSLTPDTDYSDRNIFINVKKYSNPMKLVRTTKKMAFFIDGEGKNRRTNFLNIKTIVDRG